MTGAASRPLPAVPTRDSLLPPLPTDDPEGLAALLAQVTAARGFRCASYKERCLRRRIAVRMRATATHTFGDYARLLERQPDEYDRLLDALTINVTKLFRNGEAWELLARRAIPALWARPEERLRVWSAGCSTGEEPYSLAALFQRHAETLGEGARVAERVEILGTDVDGAALAVAARARFADAAFDDVPVAVRDRWFTHVPDVGARLGAREWEAAPALRRLVRLAPLDLLRDAPPEGPWHLIVCRNVVIYFDREAQERLFDGFDAALAPGGFLFLGKVETLLGPLRHRYEALEPRERIFRKR